MKPRVTPIRAHQMESTKPTVRRPVRCEHSVRTPPIGDDLKQVGDVHETVGIGARWRRAVGAGAGGAPVGDDQKQVGHIDHAIGGHVARTRSQTIIGDSVPVHVGLRAGFDFTAVTVSIAVAVRERLADVENLVRSTIGTPVGQEGFKVGKILLGEFVCEPPG